MITVKVQRNEQNEIEAITVSGHANAAKHGSDIVCSAVSAVSMGTINAVDLLLNSDPDVQLAEKDGGFLKWNVRPVEDPLFSEKQQLLAEGMVVSLFMIAESYGKYVTVHDTKWQGGV